MFLFSSFLNYFYKSEMETIPNLKIITPSVLRMVVGSFKISLTLNISRRRVANVKEKPMDCLCERAILTPKKLYLQRSKIFY